MPAAAYSQSEEAARGFAWDVVRAVLFDPTTYAPAGLAYSATLEDWRSSQVFFAHGWLETNPRFTISGFPNDVPLSYADGKRLLTSSALDVLQISFVHNAGIGVAERLLINRYPTHKKMIRTLSWVERIGFASVLAYRNSASHFRQASTNRRLAGEYFGH